MDPLCQHPETFSLTPLQGTELRSLPKLPSSDALPRGEVMLTSATLSLYATRDSAIGSIPFPFSNFKPFSLPFRGTFHLSFTVLVRYRSLTDI